MDRHMEWPIVLYQMKICIDTFYILPLLPQIDLASCVWWIHIIRLIVRAPWLFSYNPAAEVGLKPLTPVISGMTNILLCASLQDNTVPRQLLALTYWDIWCCIAMVIASVIYMVYLICTYGVDEDLDIPFAYQDLKIIYRTLIYDTATSDQINWCQSDRKCCVCWCDFENKDTLGILPCGHIEHTKCLVEWLQRRSACPRCNILIS